MCPQLLSVQSGFSGTLTCENWISINAALVNVQNMSVKIDGNSNLFSAAYDRFIHNYISEGIFKKRDRSKIGSTVMEIKTKITGE